MLHRKEHILVVDDAPATLEVLQRNLDLRGYRVHTASGVGEALRVLDVTQVDLVITDLKMPDVSGLELVRHIRENLEDVEVMMITGYATIEKAVTAVKAGAEEFLPKPFTDEELFAAVERSIEKLRLRRASRQLAAQVPSARCGLIGRSESMGKVFRAISKAASTSATVLISGESGTGKELVARSIHYSGPHAAAPFIPVNCGGIPEPLLESELFGHVKGAFTGATEARAGFFQTADGGTIFLDEISDTSFPMQVKLLRVLQDKEVCMVGSSRTRKVDVRILAATNKDLPSLVKKNIFREDLFYRVNVITVDVPPLRERNDDVLLLARHFSARFAEEHGKPTPEFSDGALQALRGYAWPGNVRELENLVQRVVVMTDGDVIGIPELPSYMRFSAQRTGVITRTLADVEAEHIRRVLISVNGNKTRASKILDIDRKTLRDKLKRDSPQT